MSAPKFAVGDRVRALRDDGCRGYREGDEFVVVDLAGTPGFIDNDGHQRHYPLEWEGEFELVERAQIPAEQEWGAPIAVDGERLDWLRDGNKREVQAQNKFGDWLPAEWNAEPSLWSWENIPAIRLPADHPYYLATSEGFEYWPGGDAAPADWDGDREGILYRDGENIGRAPYYWGNNGGHRNIIGYHRAAKQETQQPAQAPQSPVTLESIAALVNERDALQTRVTALQTANNTLSGEKQALAADVLQNWRLFTESQDELATVRADRDEWIAAFRDLNARAMRLERDKAAALSVADMNAKSGAHWAAEYQRVQGELDAILAARPAPASDAAASEYVFGPWFAPTPGTNPIPVGSAYEWRNASGGSGLCAHNGPSDFGDDGGFEIRRAYRIGEWHEHDGGECPIDGDVRVEVRFRNGIKPAAAFLAYLLRWSHGDNPGDIVAFRPVAA